jgi:Fe2+ transport system protein FeoA
VGKDVVVVAVDDRAADATLVRLWEMGLVPGTAVRVTRRAPWGDPLEVHVRGTRLVLRAADAARFAVVPATIGRADGGDAGPAGAPAGESAR